MDGENTMTGTLGGGVTLLDKEAIWERMHIRCANHQVHLVVKDANGAYVETA